MQHGEETLLVTRPTRLLSLGYYVLTLFVWGIAGAFLLDLVPYVPEGVRVPGLGWSLETFAAVVFFVFGLVSLLYAELVRKSTRYVITDVKVIREEGILSKRTAMVPYSHLERVDVTQSVLQRILRIGTVVVDTGDDSISIDMVPKPSEIQRILSQRMGRRPTEAATGSAGRPQ
ncbi:MAG: PH domain-containing protein [Methanobacteriota archaeon]